MCRNGWFRQNNINRLDNLSSCCFGQLSPFRLLTIDDFGSPLTPIIRIAPSQHVHWTVDVAVKKMIPIENCGL